MDLREAPSTTMHSHAHSRPLGNCALKVGEIVRRMCSLGSRPADRHLVAHMPHQQNRTLSALLNDVLFPATHRQKSACADASHKRGQTGKQPSIIYVLFLLCSEPGNFRQRLVRLEISAVMSAG